MKKALIACLFALLLAGCADTTTRTTEVVTEIAELSFQSGVLCGAAAVHVLDRMERGTSGTTMYPVDMLNNLTYTEKIQVVARHLRKEFGDEKK